jgi:hypothetical protein
MRYKEEHHAQSARHLKHHTINSGLVSVAVEVNARAVMHTQKRKCSHTGLFAVSGYEHR